MGEVFFLGVLLGCVVTFFLCVMTFGSETANALDHRIAEKIRDHEEPSIEIEVERSHERFYTFY